MHEEKNPELILKKYWNFDSFRPLQKHIVRTVLSGKDCLALLPTGGGKSICFQVPALCNVGTTIVITPLISLMEDQVANLTAKNIAATFLTSTLEASELSQRMQLLAEGTYKLVYVAPERLKNKTFLSIVKNISVSLVVVDEAHCIAEWGHSFRPEYLQITSFISEFKTRPTVLALTATATYHTQKLICNALQLINPEISRDSFQRTNLRLVVFETQTHAVKLLTLLELLAKHNNQSGIIYCATRKSTEYVVSALTQLQPQLKVSHYHGGLDPKLRSEIQNKFISNTLDCIVATNAFGMGIDKAAIRFVVHYDSPISPENYYQELGRAGRDGNPSSCFTFYNFEDMQNQLDFQSETLVATQLWQLLAKAKKLQQILTTKSCKTKKLMAYFGEDIAPCGNCSGCLQKTPLLSELSSPINQNLFHKLQKFRGRYPYLSNVQNHFIALTQPETSTSLQRLPGIGTGIKNTCQKQLINLVLGSGTITA